MPGTYRLYAKIDGEWKQLCTIEAKNHQDAFQKAMLLLSPQLYDKPIRLEWAGPPQSAD